MIWLLSTDLTLTFWLQSEKKHFNTEEEKNYFEKYFTFTLQEMEDLFCIMMLLIFCLGLVSTLMIKHDNKVPQGLICIKKNYAEISGILTWGSHDIFHYIMAPETFNTAYHHHPKKECRNIVTMLLTIAFIFFRQYILKDTDMVNTINWKPKKCLTFSQAYP